MSQKELRAMLEQIKHVTLVPESEFRFWLIRSLLLIALAVREHSDSTAQALGEESR